MFSGALGAIAGGYGGNRQGLERVQQLLAEVQEMEDTLGVADFTNYFEAMRELKNLLVDEFNDIYELASKQSIEIERMNIMVEEKNKAISTLADGNEDERKELRKLRERIKELECQNEEHEEREVKLRRTIAKLRRSSNSSTSNPPTGELTPGSKAPPSPFVLEDNGSTM